MKEVSRTESRTRTLRRGMQRILPERCAGPEEMRAMGQNARRVYEEKYTPEINYNQLMFIYKEAIKENLKSQG